MTTKKFTQFGAFSVAIMGPLFVVFAVMFTKSYLKSAPEMYINLVLLLTMALCLLIFYKLTITVDSTHVSFKFGIGLIGKSYKISDIRSVRSVYNSALTGIGIRMLPNGWLYNVSGIKAIELQFVNQSKVVRIGTDKPDEICQLIQSLIVGEKHDYGDPVPEKKWINPLWILSMVVIAALVIIPNYRDTHVQFVNDEFKIKGFFGLTIPYSGFEEIDTVSALPAITLRTNGYAFGKTLIGKFKTADENQVRLFIKRGSSPYIMIKADGQLPVYINYKDKHKTVDLFNKLRNL